MLLFCDLSEPQCLWDEFAEHICDDLGRQLRRMNFQSPSEEDINDYSLFLLDNILQSSGWRLSDFAMRLPQRNWAVMNGNSLIAEQLSYNQEDEKDQANAAEECLNEE